MFELSANSRTRMKGIDPNLIAIANLAIKITKVDFGIPKYGGLRTKEDQNKLFNEGKSKADGYVKLSHHQSGEALDFYAYVDGKASWQPNHLAMVACAFLQAASMLGHKINWGCLWSSNKATNGIPYGWDMAHIELG
jgi:peptidoglycan L-alanyl-D-glutamate endopeptidase CwlK